MDPTPALRIRDRLTAALAAVGGVFLVAMVVLTCGNILLRLLWLPISGTFELMGFFGAFTVSFALGYTQVRRGHIAVDVLVDRFPPRLRRALEGLNNLVCTAFFSLAAWQVAGKAATLHRTGELTETLRIPYHPFTYGVSAGLALLALVLLLDLAAAFSGGKEGRP
jgi:TRAP-type C4-dicarboxylate transport system permease small subunit